MKAYLLAALLLPLSGPASAQAVGTGTPDTGVGGLTSPAPVTGGSVTNPGGLNLGNSSPSGIATAGSPAGTTATSPGQLDFGRTTGTGGMPSGGAGIGSSAAGVPGTTDEYTHPIYGGGGRY